MNRLRKLPFCTLYAGMRLYLLRIAALRTDYIRMCVYVSCIAATKTPFLNTIFEVRPTKHRFPLQNLPNRRREETYADVRLCV